MVLQNHVPAIVFHNPGFMMILKVRNLNAKSVGIGLFRGRKMKNNLLFLIRVLTISSILEFLNLTIWKNLNFFDFAISDFVVAFALLIIIDIIDYLSGSSKP